jgi:hydroxypyruvate isomerase
MTNLKHRRDAIKKIALGAAVVGTGNAAYAATKGQTKKFEFNKPMLKGNVNHSVCRWCYNPMPLEELIEGAQELGLKSIEILGPDDWKKVQKSGLTCAVATGPPASIENGFNEPSNHDKLIKGYTELIDQAADDGLPNVICFSGNRRDISDEQGLEHCAVGLEPLVKQAEKRNIMLIMELLNSKVNHKDYQCDKTPWGVELVEKIGSPNFKLLYDIYHMQIMEGDVIATIRQYHEHIAHYHTGGVPGRHEINETQELYYPAIIKAILETGYTGYLGQEFIPTWDDKLAALKHGVETCDV